MKSVILLGVWAGLAGCTVGPDYLRPEIAIPAQYKEADGWKVASPGIPTSSAEWWQAYGDPTLSALVAQVEVSNQTLRAADALQRQAMAGLVIARAGFFPSLSGAFTGSHSGIGGAAKGTGADGTKTSIGLTASWELDLWGRVRREVEAGNAAVAASGEDFKAVLLSTQSTLAQTYVLLRVTEAQRQLLGAATQAYARALQITRNRYAAGVASRLDVSQAETQLQTTQAAALDSEVQTAQLEHELATLVGQAPADFRFDVSSRLPELPTIPIVLPSELLERRPDIAAAERRMVGANATIGIAQAAFFPSLSLGVKAGFQGATLANLAALPYSFWSVGPALAQTLFDGGLRKGQKQQAIAAYDVSVAQYRQTVLSALREVEDNLAALRVLGEESVVQDAASKAAAESQALALNQYKAGTVSYLNVVTAQTSALTAARAALDVRGRQLLASVVLLKALGGGWQAEPPM